MQKIKITTTSRMIQPTSLENIDISYGMSFLTKKDNDVRVMNFEDFDDWTIKTLSSVDKVINIFKQDKEEKEILNQLISDSVFLSKQTRENLEDLYIQFNTETNTTKRLQYIADNSELSEFLDNSLQSYLFSGNAIFLGINALKKGNIFYDSLSKNLTQKEIVSYTLFHEYGYSMLNHNQKTYKDIGKTGSSFDNLDYAINMLAVKRGSQNLLTALEKLIDSEDESKHTQLYNDFQVPSQNFALMLARAQENMYADAFSLLLMRNKAIEEKSFNEEKFQTLIEAVIDVSYVKKEESKKLREKAKYRIYHPEGFTAPAIESLNVHLKDSLSNKNIDTPLSEEQIHKVATKCMQEGMSKVITTILLAAPDLKAVFNTIFSIKKEEYITVDKDFNHYQDAKDKMFELIPDEWKIKCRANLEKSNAFTYDMIYDSALDYASLENNMITKTKVKDRISTVRENQKELNNMIQAKLK